MLQKKRVEKTPREKSLSKPEAKAKLAPNTTPAKKLARPSKDGSPKTGSPAMSHGRKTKQGIRLDQSGKQEAVADIIPTGERLALVEHDTYPEKAPEVMLALAPDPAPEVASMVDTEVAGRRVIAVTDRPSKRSVLISLLERQEGATIDQLAKDLAWLPHTVRASLTGLRKSGYSIIKEASSGGGRSVYLILGGADALPKPAS